jgi:hypothetical protein
MYTAVGVNSASPSNGGIFGGTFVTISGQGFTGATSVTIGGVALTGVTVVNDTTITGTTGAHAAGTVDIVVTAPAGTITGAGEYIYSTTVTSVSPSAGPFYGGTPVTITGTGLKNATSASIGGGNITSFVEVNDTTITGNTAAHAPGTVNAIVTNGTQSATGTNEFTYTGALGLGVDISADVIREMNRRVAVPYH